MGSHLVTIGNAEENEFVFQTLAKKKTLWIGLYRNPVNFAWVTGERVTYTNWINPKGNDGNERCTEMTDYSVFYGMWNDNNCDLGRQGYICEQDQYVSGLFNMRKGVAINSHVISEPKTATDIDCVLHCLQTVDCKSVNFYNGRSTKLCQLNNASNMDYPGGLSDDNESVYYEKISG
ncbi:hypothetical protein QZH41_012569 [Actinostola sp. cb2023]|nr:hypothetical protein QZH41_012569 [Actinostola sp. cb2023]